MRAVSIAFVGLLLAASPAVAEGAGEVPLTEGGHTCELPLVPPSVQEKCREKVDSAVELGIWALRCTQDLRTCILIPE